MGQAEKEKTKGSSVCLEPDFELVETGESRTPLSISETISSNIPHVSSLSTSSVPEFSFCNVSDLADLGSDPTKLLPLLLDQLIALGQTAQQIRTALGSNGNRPEKSSELLKQLAQGGKKHAS